jgi:hypothetical protein
MLEGQFSKRLENAIGLSTKNEQQFPIKGRNISMKFFPRLYKIQYALEAPHESTYSDIAQHPIIPSQT